MPVFLVRSRMRLLFLFLSVLVLISACGAGSSTAPVSSAPVAGARSATGWFGISVEAGRWNLTAPDGTAFFSRGVNCLLMYDGAVKPTSFGYDVTKVPGFDTTAWANSLRARVEGWGFNTAGSWSADAVYASGMPFTVTLHMTGNADLIKVFDDDYDSMIRARAKPNVEKWAGSRSLIGYFTDNELPWYGMWGWPSGSPTLLERFAALPASGKGKSALVEFFQARYDGDFGKLKESWDIDAADFDGLANATSFRGKGSRAAEDVEEFMGVVAEQYGKVVSRVLKELDPNHLNLGVRIAGFAPDPVIRALGKYVDVFSLNLYRKSGHIPKKLLRHFHELTGKPIMITEFSYRAMENRSGDMNTGGADVTVPTQADRAKRLRTYITELVSCPFVIGYHWFLLFDQSPGGRTFDGENSNYGLVDVYDKDYDELIAAFKDVNASCDQLHAAAMPLPPPSLGTPLASSDAPAVNAAVPILAAAKPSAKDPVFWGDAGGGASATRGKGGTEWFKSKGPTGHGWGYGWSFFFTADGRDGIDVTGAKSLQVRVRIPKGIAFRVFLAEAGAAASDAESFSGARGADGESYESPEMIGTGDWHTYRIPLEKLNVRDSWGNNGGNGVLDLQAISWCDLYFAGNQGNVDFALDSLVMSPEI
ncbi:MAG: hypothetical protein AAB229_08295 [Candidatus Hydrogenedentota bacterium]